MSSSPPTDALTEDATTTKKPAAPKRDKKRPAATAQEEAPPPLALEEEQPNNNKRARTTERVQELTVAWKTVDQVVQRQLAPPSALSTEDQQATTAVVVLLNQVPVASSGLNTAENIKAAKDAKAAKFAPGGGGKDAPRGTFLRVTFLVTRVLAPGWGSIEIGTAPAPTVHRGRQQQAPVKLPRERLSRMHEGEHVFMHSYTLGAANKRVGVTPEFIVVSPGMVLTTFAWDSEIDRIFPSLTRDLQPFEVCVVELTTKAWSPSNEKGLLDLRKLTAVPECAAAALLPRALAATSIQHATLLRERFLKGLHLLPASAAAEEAPAPPLEEGEEAPPDPRLPKGLTPACLTKNLDSGYISLVYAAPSNGLFVEGVDGAILFQATTDAPIADVPSATFRVVFDPRQLPTDALVSPAGDGETATPLLLSEEVSTRDGLGLHALTWVSVR